MTFSLLTAVSFFYKTIIKIYRFILFYCFFGHLYAFPPAQIFKCLYFLWTGDPSDIFPAQIYGSTSVKVGQNLELMCIANDLKEDIKQIHMYLCKNADCLRMKRLGATDEHTFTLRNLSEQDSGNYSCVYSFQKYALMDMRNISHNAIHVQVKGKKSICLITITINNGITYK